MKTYDLIKRLLETNEGTRNSDKLLYAEVLRTIGAVKKVEWFGEREAILLDTLTSGSTPSYETIRRTRQKIQETIPELQATSSQVRVRRKQKQDTKGTFIYREWI